MSKARLVITAVTVEKRPVSEVARAYGVARSWVYTLLARYQAEGEAAFEPRSRRPKTSPSAISADTADLIIRLRKELAGQGLDAGPQTIAWHLAAPPPGQGVGGDRQPVPDPGRAGHPQPRPSGRSRPTSGSRPSMPNECWQSDFTHYPLAGGTDTEILTWLDDHSRYALSVTAHDRVTGPDRARWPSAQPCAAARRPGLDPDRQRHGLHHPPVRRQGRPQRPRARAAPPRHHARRTASPTTRRPRARSSDSSRR